MIDDPHNHSNDDHTKLARLDERQRQMLKRLDDFEKTQKEMQTMINRYIGGSAILVGVGVFVGWLFTIGSGALTFFQHK